MKDHVEGAKLADNYTELCKDAVGYMKAMEEYNPALMNTVGKWLKDNNITVDSRNGTPMDSLANDFKTYLSVNKTKHQEIPPPLRDFRNFLYLVWKHLNLPDPTELQYDIADYMQHGPKRSTIMAFRGVGKSWICSAYVVHQLLLDPTKNVLVVSASKNRADDFSTFTLKIIHDIPYP
jgi:hypothetical protein